jgi:hypothetical protein
MNRMNTVLLFALSVLIAGAMEEVRQPISEPTAEQHAVPDLEDLPLQKSFQKENELPYAEGVVREVERREQMKFACEPAEKNKDGWYFCNSTDQIIYVAWYITKIATLYRYSYGNKRRIAAVVPIGPKTSVFVPFPPREQKGWLGWAMTKNDRRELLATFEPALLTEEIAANENYPGEILNEHARDALFIFTKEAFGGDPEAESTPCMITFEQPQGTQEIILGRKMHGWYFKNLAGEKKVVYCRWYSAAINGRIFGVYSNRNAISRLLTLKSSEEEFIEVPKHIISNHQRQLLFSFNQSQLTDEVIASASGALPAGIEFASQNRLGSFGSIWQITNENNTPKLDPHTNLIRVINTTNDPLYCAIYRVSYRTGAATRFEPFITEVNPQLSVTMRFPSIGVDTRVLVIGRTSQKHLLVENTTWDAIIKSGLVAKTFMRANLIRWYIQGEFEILYDVQADNPLFLRVASVGGDLYQRAARGWKDISLSGLLERFEVDMKERKPLFVPAADILDARNESSIEAGKSNALTREKLFVANRSVKVKAAINKLLGQGILKEGSYVPKIALVFSGGGNRAMTQTIGYLKGAANQKGGNILDCCMYMCALSGSTWAVNPFVLSGLTPEQFAHAQSAKVNNGTSHFGTLFKLINNLVSPNDSHQLKLTHEYIRRRFIESRYGQFHGLIGLYGHALANAWLDGLVPNKSPHDVTLSDLRNNLADGSGMYPLPISVAVDDIMPGSGVPRLWYEFSPYYIGTHQEKGAWVDTQLFGSIFNKGMPVDVVPEYPLAQYMGTWGSAFAVSPTDAANAGVPWVASAGYQATANAFYGLYNVLLWKTPDQPACPFKAAASEMPNFTFGFEDVSSRLNKAARLCLVDGGITKEGKYRHNFASAPALYRDCDILIMCDSHANPNADLQSEHLFAASEEAARLRKPFPNLTDSRVHEKALAQMGKGAFALFDEGDPKVPLVIYMNCKKNDLYDPSFDPDASVAGFTNTMNFDYTLDQFNKLTGLTESIFIQAKGLIQVAIQEVLKRKGVMMPGEEGIPQEFLAGAE